MQVAVIDLGEQAQSVLMASAENNPTSHGFGFFTYGDAPGGIGGGVGAFQWFASAKERDDYIIHLSPYIYDSVDSEAEYQELTNFFSELASTYGASSAEFQQAYNTRLRGNIQSCWTGSFQELCQSSNSFCQDVRAWFRGADEDSETRNDNPITPREKRSFVRAIQTYGM
jgi:hypothetical protein